MFLVAAAAAAAAAAVAVGWMWPDLITSLRKQVVKGKLKKFLVLKIL